MKIKSILVASSLVVAPLAASAAELDLKAVNQYSSQDQVTSVAQFSDVKPTDWAYQALSNLVNQYGCVAGYPNGTFAGGQALTRYEAAALLNACLDRVTETTDELKKLLNEFKGELAVLKGRVDGLDAKVGQLEANQFSTTTKLAGVATMTLGAASNGKTAETNLGGSAPDDHIAFNYDLKLNLDTSFTGKDLLRTTLRANNFQNNIFGQNGSAALEVASSPSNTAVDAIGINRLFYQFPVGKGFTATVGAKVRQDDMLAMWPTAYGADTILDRMTYAGASGAYSLNLGAGAGLTYKNPNGFNASVNYVSNQLSANSSGSSYFYYGSGAFAEESGVGSASTTTVQVGYAKQNWGAAFAYTYSDAANSYALNDLNASYSSVNANNLGFSAYWQPTKTGYIPSVSAGVGTSYGPESSPTTWQVALQWQDAFAKGNALGMAYGSTQIGGTAAGNSAYEVFYKFQVTDNIAVTPAFFWINGGGENADSTGGVLKTTFKF
jgi:hypothetical protein